MAERNTKTEIILTTGLLSINEHDIRTRVNLEIMHTVDNNGNSNLDLVYEAGGDWNKFWAGEEYDPECLEGWEPEAIREALAEIKKLEWLADSIKESEDWDYCEEWADAAEETLAAKE